MFFLQSEDQPSGLSDPADHSRLTENVARAFCVALCPQLKLLKEDGMGKLGLRVTLDSDQVRAPLCSGRVVPQSHSQGWVWMSRATKANQDFLFTVSVPSS